MNYEDQLKPSCPRSMVESISTPTATRPCPRTRTRASVTSPLEPDPVLPSPSRTQARSTLMKPQLRSPANPSLKRARVLEDVLHLSSSEDSRLASRNLRLVPLIRDS